MPRRKTTQEHRKDEAQIRANQERNPSLKLGLGDLIHRANELYHQNNHVVLPEERVPEESLPIYQEYQKIITELNRRGSEYEEVDIIARKNGQRRLC